MNADLRRCVTPAVLRGRKWVVLSIVGLVTLSALGGTGEASVVLWDTGSGVSQTVGIENRTAWKAVPSDLMTLEADPPKAAMDPGYYGREYAFAGDAVIENDHVTIVFASGQGTVLVYPRTDPGQDVLRFAPTLKGTKNGRIDRCSILENTGDAVTLKVFFSSDQRGEEPSVVFSLDRTPIVEIRHAEDMEQIHLASSMAYGVVPSFVGDDLVFDAEAYPAVDSLCVPSDNLFLGLLKGHDRVLVMTWPEGHQKVKLQLDGGQGDRLINAIDFDHDGHAIYLALLEAPGIWHEETFKLSYLEKDVTSSWKRPFPAKWVTQLNEAGVKATYTFKESEGPIWRGAAGMYTYPVWFDGDSAVYHMSKKVIPRGESIVYCVEGQGTPASVMTPVDILKATLGRGACEPILDVAGRKLRTHHRRGGEGIRRACTCGCTAAIEEVFNAGDEVKRASYVEGAVGDMVYFVQVHLERIDEYRYFANEMIDFLHATTRKSPQLKPFLDDLEKIVQQIPEDYAVQKANLKSLEYAQELASQTIELTHKKSDDNLPTCLTLGELWRGMGGAQDGLLAEYHVIARNLFQQAGYGAVASPEAVAVAQEIRKRCKQCLRNADGYEIWPGY